VVGMLAVCALLSGCALFRPSLPESQAEDVAHQLMQHLEIGSPATVLMVGPVAPGMLIRERVPREGTPVSETGAMDSVSPVELVVPGDSGEYYAFFIDEEPEARFCHDVRYAWLDAESGAFSVVEGQLPPVFVEQGQTFLCYTVSRTFVVDGVVFGLGHRGAPGKSNEISDKSEAARPSPSPAVDCRKVALVLDCGDLDDHLIAGDLADDFAADAKKVAEYLEANDYAVQRISQSWENSVPALKNSLTLRDDLEKMIDAYAALLKCPAKECCHEFFLYVSAHGDKEGFDLYDPRGNGLSDRVKYSQLDTWLSRFPSCVKIIVFVDACYSGNAITKMTKTLDRCNAETRCGVTIMTSAAADKTSPGGAGSSTSGTQHFLDGEDEDHDNDGKEGDLYDRYREMKRELEDDSNPQSKLCPNQGSYCSLD
jgi:hypothetical protein